MGIFQRAHDIVQAKTNKALDAAEKPDEMLDLSYEKMLEQITQVRRALVDLAGVEEASGAPGGAVPAHRRPPAGPGQAGPRRPAGRTWPRRRCRARPRPSSRSTRWSRSASSSTKRRRSSPRRSTSCRSGSTTSAPRRRPSRPSTPRPRPSRRSTRARPASRSRSTTPGQSLQRAQDKIATMQARSGALDELLESGVLEDVGGGTDDIQKELDQVGKDAAGRQRAGRPEGAAGHRRPARARCAGRPAPRPSRSRGVVAGLVVRRGVCPARSGPRRRPAGSPASSWRKWPAPSMVTCALAGRAGHVRLQDLRPAAGGRDHRRRTR